MVVAVIFCGCFSCPLRFLSYGDKFENFYFVITNNDDKNSVDKSYMNTQLQFEYFLHLAFENFKIKVYDFL